MFETLREGISSALRSLRGYGRLTEANMREGIQLVQKALLEADVSLPVVKQFIARVTEKAVGERVLKSLNPTQQLVAIVYEELVNLMGPVDHTLHLKPGVGVVMLCGLQGSGKTTTCAKLAKLLLERGKKPLLVAADLQRPAAIDQLETLGQRVGVPVYVERDSTDPVAVCQNAIRYAKQNDRDVAILDTAGRLHVDEELMQQLTKIDYRVQPDEVLFVVDAMTGQDAVNSAKAFNEALELDGVILTKLDGDARGGAALSVKAITGVPIKFVGTGEGLEALEEFHPDRMASRILGMGDVLTLVEEARRKLDEEEMRRQQERLARGEFTLEDFRKLIDQTRRLGSLGRIMELIPGMSVWRELAGDEDAEIAMRRLRGIIDSMTPEERRNPKIIDASRRRRIARGAGVQPNEVADLLRQFDTLATLMREMSGMGLRGRLRAVQEISRNLMVDPTGRSLRGLTAKAKSGKRLSKEEKERLRKLREREARRKRRQAKGKRK